MPSPVPATRSAHPVPRTGTRTVGGGGRGKGTAHDRAPAELPARAARAQPARPATSLRPAAPHRPRLRTLTKPAQLPKSPLLPRLALLAGLTTQGQGRASGGRCWGERPASGHGRPAHPTLAAWQPQDHQAPLSGPARALVRPCPGDQAAQLKGCLRTPPPRGRLLALRTWGQAHSPLWQGELCQASGSHWGGHCPGGPVGAPHWGSGGQRPAGPGGRR